jgi:glycosyltransferase involved in cell wall biosynthesis
LRIAHVIGRLSVGGAERHFVNLLNAMEGHERHAILISPPGDGPSLADQLRPEVSVHFVPVSRRRLPLDIPKLAGLIRSLRLDVVHTHMFWASLYGAVAGRLAGAGAIFTTEHGENRWKTATHRWLERRVISPLADCRYCVSPQILEARRDRDGVPSDKLRIVANGVPLPDVSARHAPPVPVIGSVGRFVSQKAFPDLVHAAALLRDEGHEFRLVIVGDGVERKAVEAAVERFALSDRVELTGFRMDVADILSGLSLFASSSIQEGQPLALLEAMAWGLPCVVTDVGAVAATLKNGVEGQIVEPGNPRALATALARYLDSRELADAAGTAARQRVEREFSSHAVALRHLNDYQGCLRRKGLLTGESPA